MELTKFQITTAFFLSALMSLVAALSLMTLLPSPLPEYAWNISNFLLEMQVYLFLGVVVFGIIGGIIVMLAYFVQQ